MKKSYRSLVLVFCVVVLVFAFASCGGNNEPESSDSPKITENPQNESTQEPDGIYVKASDRFTKFDTRISYDGAESITLKDGASNATGDGVLIEGDIITINRGGSYVLSGKLSDGQIIVEVDKTEKVQLVFNGVDITSKKSSPVYIKSADKVAITLAQGTENILSDADNYEGQNEKGEPNACVFSKDDLTINGYGKLTVKGNSNNGISTKNDFKLVSGEVIISAKNNALKGKGSILVNSGSLNVESDDDGLKSDEDEDPAKGFILIEGGNISIKAGDDALTAFTSVTISGGHVIAKALGKSVNCDGTVNIATGTLEEK